MSASGSSSIEAENSSSGSAGRERKRVPVMGDHLVPTSKRVAVIGGGLVGAMDALFMARRGFDVEVYEMRTDIRQEEVVEGRSINLALSTRGREALRALGLEDEVLKTALPMRGRMIHSLSGQQSFIPYGTKHQCIYSVDRRKLNETLLSAAEECPNVVIHFEHKLTQVNASTGEMAFLSNDQRHESSADLIVGCDGAFSGVRRNMMRTTRVNYQQEYIPHGYKELTMPAKEDGTHAMANDCLHIWPRNEFMMIALPNADGTFTCTLFLPFAFFNGIKEESQVMEAFEKYFPDSIPLFGREQLADMFLANPVGNVMSIKCNPHSFGDRCILLGDAAHAMVPFYGQGMNCGFEDCLILDELLSRHKFDFGTTLPAYNERRQADAEAICDLALYNYVEMRSLVNSRRFLLRKKLDTFLHWLLPGTFIPLYSMVTFSRIPYRTVIEKRRRQDAMVNTGMVVVSGLLCSAVSYGLWCNRTTLATLLTRLTNRFLQFTSR